MFKSLQAPRPSQSQRVIRSLEGKMKVLRFLLALFSLSMPRRLHGLSTSQQPSKETRKGSPKSRRAFVASVVSAAVATTASLQVANAVGADLKFETAKSGIQWADAKIGTGTALKPGNQATVDYVLSTTGARYGSRIFATSDKDMPYRWTLGDGSTISGLEQAIVGADGIPPMLPGGVRRVIIPQNLGYETLAASVGSAKEFCVQDGRPGPIPPPNQAFEEYQRFKNIYCNPNRQYQPDIVMDVKLYGARSLR